MNVKIIGIGIVLLVSVVLLYDAGYITMGQNFELISPSGDSNIINEDTLFSPEEESSSDKELSTKNYQSLIDDIYENCPESKNIEWEIYATNTNKMEVINAYKEKIEDKGYTLKYDDTYIYDGVPVDYLVYEKGLMGIGVAVCNSEDVSNYISVSEENVVLYTTGSLLDYNAIKTYLEEEYNMEI